MCSSAGHSHVRLLLLALPLQLFSDEQSQSCLPPPSSRRSRPERTVMSARSHACETRIRDNGQAGKRKEKARHTGHGEKEDEEEEVKTISGLINSAPSVDDDDEDDMFSEIESLLGGEIDIPIPGDRYDVKERSRYNAHMANNPAEMERLRGLVRELEEREVKLEGELLEYYGLKEQETDVTELQKQLKIKTVEVDMLNLTISSLQAERKKLQEDVARGAAAKKELDASRSRIKELQRQIQMEANQTKGQLMLLKQQVMGLRAKEEEVAKKDAEIEQKLKKLKNLEVEVLELRRKNKELLYEKRDLMVKLDAAQGKITESDVVAHAREEINNLRHTNEDLTKQVEGLQMNRFSEVEELVYLRWVNACLRFELRNYQTPSGKISARDLSTKLSPRSQERAKQMMLEFGSERGQGDTDLDSVSSAPSSPRSEDFDTASIDSSSSKYSFLSKRPNLMQKLKKWGRSKDDGSYLSSPSSRSLTSSSPKRSQKPKGPLESLMIRNAGDGMSITTFGKRDQESGDADDANVASSFQLMSKNVEGFADEKYPAYKDRHKLATEREKAIKEKAEQARAQRFGGGYSSVLVPSPRAALPPKLAQIKEKNAPTVNSEPGRPGGPPPPPPPPGSLSKSLAGGDKVHRAPEVVEFYQSLMKREAKKDTTSLGSKSSNVSDNRSNMIGEIENRSTFLLAVKADVETQGEFVESLAGEVRAARFANIDDVVAFVHWLDEELSFLVDERAVLKHFDWPESKTDALREAAFEYQDLVKLENKATSFVDDPKLPCEEALKRMYSLLEKVEQSVYALLRTRDMTTARYKEYGIPVDWLSDSGKVGKIKLASVQLAKKYMERVTSELDALQGTEKEPNREFLLLQGVRFAFRVHQYVYIITGKLEIFQIKNLPFAIAQFAGGFDADSMKVFEELRSKMSSTQAPAPPASDT
ncbi:hypothetical protein TRIUR3_01863 [Triticum urartu]|uniref:Protein CHUP1, chloroplastic n=1 Tax=Triticum urartu TaxID=4572 RepID=M7YYG1_TRIUA|nr:hypothetical protein TRIUR3_01863 [Triticum urartu]